MYFVKMRHSDHGHECEWNFDNIEKRNFHILVFEANGWFVRERGVIFGTKE